MSRLQNSVRNIKINYIFQIVSILASFVTRRIFTQMLSAEYLGLNGTFSSILSMLSLAELGVGVAITYSLYKPLAQNDYGLSASLMRLYRIAYSIIGIVVAVCGVAITPFLGVIIKDLPDIPHISLIYILFVFDTSLSYFFVYKQSLITADQRQYVVTVYTQCGKIILYIAQIIGLLLTHDFFVYLIIKIISTVGINVALAIKADRMYPWLKDAHPKPLDEDNKKAIIKNTVAMISHKIGTVVVFGTDNLLMSYFSGVVAVGLYSNYTMVTAGFKMIIGTLFSSITASIGNLGASENDNSRKEDVFNKVNFLGGWIYGVTSVCLFVMINPFITLWVGESYLFSIVIALVISINYYLSGMRSSVLTFKDAFGLYWYDRYKPLFESAINLIASILLALRFGVLGILIGTTISTLATCFWIEPWVLYKHGFGHSSKMYFVGYIKNTVVTLIVGVAMYYLCSLISDGGILVFILKCCICFIGSNLIFLAAYFRNENFKYLKDLAFSLVKGKR